MNRMDKSFTPDKPLLFEIDRIDVRNFNGRRDKGEPHIVLYTKDGVSKTHALPAQVEAPKHHRFPLSENDDSA